jgi:hypothetical protein
MIILAEKLAGQNSAYRHRNMKGAFGNEGALRFLQGSNGSFPRKGLLETSPRAKPHSPVIVIRQCEVPSARKYDEGDRHDALRARH